MSKKASVKEGGKKGVDMCGMSDLGGVKFFTITLESAGEDWDLMSAVLEGMNAPVDEAAEERKGGAGALGKILLSAGDKKLLILAHVPAALAAEKEFNATEWVESVAKAAGGAIISTDGDVIKAEALGDAEKELFPLKQRDAAQQAGFGYLKTHGLIPDDDSDDDYIPDPESVGIEW